MYVNGINMSEIGRRVGRDHTTILYWVKKYRVDPNNYFSVLEKQRQREEIEERQKRETESRIKKIQAIRAKDAIMVENSKNPFLCENCKKRITDPKWVKTNWCGRACWNTLVKDKEEIYSRL